MTVSRERDADTVHEGGPCHQQATCDVDHRHCFCMHSVQYGRYARLRSILNSLNQRLTEAKYVASRMRFAHQKLKRIPAAGAGVGCAIMLWEREVGGG